MAESTDTEQQQNGCVLFLLAWVLGWTSAPIAALAFSKAWEWFVADTFGVTEVSFVQAWGLYVLAHFATATIALPEKKKQPVTAMDVFTVWLTSIIVSLTVLGSLLILVQFR
jgi:hypothetical protein